VSYKLNFSPVGAVVNDTVCHSKSHGVESFQALRLIRIARRCGGGQAAHPTRGAQRLVAFARRWKVTTTNLSS
jgi:hypothetical protein